MSEEVIADLSCAEQNSVYILSCQSDQTTVESGSASRLSVLQTPSSVSRGNE